MQRIKITHINDYQQLPKKIAGLEQEIKDNAASLEAERQKLIGLERKHAHVQIVQITTDIIPGYQQKIEQCTAQKKKDSAPLQEMEAKLYEMQVMRGNKRASVNQLQLIISELTTRLELLELTLNNEKSTLANYQSQLQAAKQRRDEPRMSMPNLSSEPLFTMAMDELKTQTLSSPLHTFPHNFRTMHSPSLLIHAHNPAFANFGLDILNFGLDSDSTTNLSKQITELELKITLADNNVRRMSNEFQIQKPLLGREIAKHQQELTLVSLPQYEAKLASSEIEVMNARSIIANHDHYITKIQEDIDGEYAKIRKLERQHGKATTSDILTKIKENDLQSQLVLLNGQIQETKWEISRLELPTKNRNEAIKLRDDLFGDEIFQRLLLTPEAVLKDLLQMATKAVDTFEKETVVAHDEALPLRIAEFRRDIKLISPEDNIEVAIEGEEFQPGLEVKSADVAQNKCFQLCGLLQYMQKGGDDDAWKSFKAKLATVTNEAHFDESCSNRAFSSLLQSQNPRLELVSKDDLNNQQQIDYQAALKKFHKALRPFKLKPTKEMLQFTEKMTALADIPAFKNDSYTLAFTTEVLHAATQRIENHRDQEVAKKLDLLSKHIKSEQPNQDADYWAKVTAFVGAIVALAALAVITFLTYGASAPTTIPLAAKIAVDTGIGLGGVTTIAGLVIARNSKATGTTKIIIAAKEALNNAPASFFFKHRKKLNTQVAEHKLIDTDLADTLSTDNGEVLNRSGVEGVANPSAPPLSPR